MKPVPVMPTVPTPDTPCGAARVMVGVPKTVSIADAVFPDASVTEILHAPGFVEAAITVPTFAGTSPSASVTGRVVSNVAGVTPVLYQLIVVPLMVIVSADDIANPAPVIVNVAPARAAVALRVIVGTTVNVAVAEAEPADTVIVCAPATVKVLAGMLVV